jgi:hypothetical protein
VCVVCILIRKKNTHTRGSTLMIIAW